MPTYCVGKELLQSRTSFREILCEQCGKSMGRIYATRIPEKLEGLSAQDVLAFCPSMKLDIQVHEKECPAQKKEAGPAGAVDPAHD
jgi:hypothetical protein